MVIAISMFQVYLLDLMLKTNLRKQLFDPAQLRLSNINLQKHQSSRVRLITFSSISWNPHDQYHKSEQDVWLEKQKRHKALVTVCSW